MVVFFMAGAGGWGEAKEAWGAGLYGRHGGCAGHRCSGVEWSMLMSISCLLHNSYLAL